MPTYEYACKACGEHLEVVQSFNDEPITVCPSCGGELRKVFGSVGIVFKGSGFYKTDSRTTSKAGKGSGKTGGSSQAAETSGGESSGTEKSSKPEAAPASGADSSKGSTTSGSSEKAAVAAS